MDWDSEQLGIHCGLIDCTGIGSTYEAKILSDFINKLIKKNINIEFITIKLPQHYIETVNSLVKFGATLIDTEYTYRFSKNNLKRINSFSVVYSYV